MTQDLRPEQSDNLPLASLVSTSAAVAATAKRSEKIGLLADLLRSASEPEVPVVVAYLSGEIPQGRIGIGPATLRSATVEPVAVSGLALRDVDAAFERIATQSGTGSSAVRLETLQGLFARATAAEQEFLKRLSVGELRQGSLEGIMADAVARAFGVPAKLVRRANMLAGDLPQVAKDALRGGREALAGYRVQLFRPLHPMLASTADDATEALARLDRASFEWKLDGARVQVHRKGADVRVYTRKLNEVTGAVPEVVAAALAIEANEFVLDGETIALRPDETPHPFQTTMRRFGRKLDIERLQVELPLSVFFFDALSLAGETLLDRPYAERIAALEVTVPERHRIPRIESSDVTRASEFLADARSRGHEGLMAKSLDAVYEAGRRGKGWLKIKPVHTLDLVVLAAEWGHGRRHGWLSNLHLGAHDPATGGFVMLGKTFKGMTDETLKWQTEALLALLERRERHVVYVRPELVVEIAFNDVQASSRYPGGLALRFARLKGYRPDKSASEADTIDVVRAIHRAQTATPESEGATD